MGENCLFVPYVKVEVVEVVPFCFPFWFVSLNVNTDWGKVRVCKWGTAACNARFYKSLSCFNKQVRIFAVNGLWTAQLYSQYIYSHSNIIYIYICNLSVSSCSALASRMSSFGTMAPSDFHISEPPLCGFNRQNSCSPPHKTCGFDWATMVDFVQQQCWCDQ